MPNQIKVPRTLRTVPANHILQLLMRLTRSSVLKIIFIKLKKNNNPIFNLALSKYAVITRATQSSFTIPPFRWGIWESGWNPILFLPKSIIKMLSLSGSFTAWENMLSAFFLQKRFSSKCSWWKDFDKVWETRLMPDRKAVWNSAAQPHLQLPLPSVTAHG